MGHRNMKDSYSEREILWNGIFVGKFNFYLIFIAGHTTQKDHTAAIFELNLRHLL